MRASLKLFPRIFYCNLLEENVDLNKLLSILGKKFVEEVRDDYFIIIPRRTNGSRKTIHCLLYEELEVKLI
jgi:hypothetical protein